MSDLKTEYPHQNHNTVFQSGFLLVQYDLANHREHFPIFFKYLEQWLENNLFSNSQIQWQSPSPFSDSCFGQGLFALSSKYN